MITVKFSCKLCGLYRVPCEVRERRDGEDIIHYIRAVTEAVALRHQVKSFLCEATELTELLIPTDGEGRAGGTDSTK